jgi:hypothetical protein
MKKDQMTSVSRWLGVLFCAASLAGCVSDEKGTSGPVLNVPDVDNSTYTGKTMFGYQGWFSHPDAPAPGDYWRHWGDLSTTNIEPCTIDMLPDLREYGEDEKFDTAYTLPNGQPAQVFSSVHPRTVERHMRWVRDYNIDGVFQQRFLSDIKGDHGRRVCDQIVRNTKAGCDKYGRVFAMMYDGSGSQNVAEAVKKDWIHLVDNVGILGDSYLNHNGRPLVALWGFNRSTTTTPQALSELIDWFHHGAPEKYRASVKLGVFPGFHLNAAYAETMKKAEVLSPWYVGCTETREQYETLRTEMIAPAKKWCEDAGILFVPVIYPGFSWYNLRNGGDPQNRTPRDGGKYYWMQSHMNLELGVESMYLAMLDEVDECTAFFKTVEDSTMSPVEGWWLDLDADGYKLPSDWYLRCAGKTAAIVRGDLPNSPDLGTPNEGIMTVYPLAGGLRFVFPDFDGQKTIEISLDGGKTWAYSTPDHVGEFEINSLPAGAADVFVRHPQMDAVPMGEVTILGQK